MVASKPNDGLDAAGFLLLAEGHLAKADGKLAGAQKAHEQWAQRLIASARMSTNQASILLKQEMEEPCKP